ncbi:hypothetical protein BD413DRAFT_48194 [Trametes elegans]|nr:hypothetical protein BD413DRAFT_48194 [Trametes elegans]
MASCLDITPPILLDAPARVQTTTSSAHCPIPLAPAPAPHSHWHDQPGQPAWPPKTPPANTYATDSSDRTPPLPYARSPFQATIRPPLARRRMHGHTHVHTPHAGHGHVPPDAARACQVRCVPTRSRARLRARQLPGRWQCSHTDHAAFEASPHSPDLSSPRPGPCTRPPTP